MQWHIYATSCKLLKALFIVKLTLLYVRAQVQQTWWDELQCMQGTFDSELLKPLSQLAPDRFKTRCDRKFSNSYVLSLPLHDASHLFYPIKWSPLRFEHIQNSEATLGDSNCCTRSHEHSHNVAQHCVDSQECCTNF